MKDDFHYLNVSLVGKSTVYDAMDCAFECLSSPLCFSFNLATFRRAKGKFLCKVLSTDKYRTATQYGGNMSSHRFSTALLSRNASLKRDFLVLSEHILYTSMNDAQKVAQRCKHNYADEFVTNNFTLHIYIDLLSPCSSSPCQNQALCVTNYKYGTFKCLCGEGFTGEFWENGRWQTQLLFNYYYS
ncbi:hypothetical protein pdam_00016163 [Pocillopora damicornis]|uniref:EGF-like domain-containing protein n=1 Tax=Pocillopora damicornis TaxID=46731 RepID=A0A3M6UMW8_POCDA|nr:hypothetical protein pdam_00016163 [Pocillopora damicornis]